MGLVESSKNNTEQIFGLSRLGYKFLCLVLTWNKFGHIFICQNKDKFCFVNSNVTSHFLGNWLAFFTDYMWISV